MKTRKANQPSRSSAGKSEEQEVVDPLAPALEVVGEEEDDRELGQLRRLERERAQADPAVGVVHRLQEEHHDEQQGGDDQHRE